MTLLAMHRRALLQLANTDQCQPWFARDFITDGFALRACHGRGPHDCGHGCPGYGRHVLTVHGQHLAWLLQTISEELAQDTAPPMTQLTIPGVAP